MAFYPVTDEEIALAAKRADGMTVYVRSDIPLPDGRTVPIGSYGSPRAYSYRTHDGKTYGVPLHWDYTLG